MKLIRLLKRHRLLGVINREQDKLITLEVESKFKLIYDGMENVLILNVYNKHKLLHILNEHIINYEKSDNLANAINRVLIKNKFIVDIKCIHDFTKQICNDRSEGICYGTLKMKKVNHLTKTLNNVYYYYIDDFYFWFYKKELYYGYEDLELGKITNDNYAYGILCKLYDSNIEEFDPTIIDLFLRFNGIKINKNSNEVEISDKLKYKVE